MNFPAITAVFSAACPWLLLILLLEHLATWCGLTVRGWALLLLAGAIAFGVLLLPIEGVGLAGWAAGLSANVSISLTGIVAVAVWERAFARIIFSPQEWTTAWITGAIGGVALYPFALGVSSFDPYEWGWRFSPLFVVVGAMTAWLIWRRNRFGFLLLLAIAAFQLHLLESSNYWDYLLDPFYCLTSLVVPAGRLKDFTRASLTNRFS